MSIGTTAPKPRGSSCPVVCTSQLIGADHHILFLGDVTVDAHAPNADGTAGDWTRSAGITDWELIDDQPLVTTDYLYSSTALDQVTVNVADATGSADIQAVGLWTQTEMKSGGNRDIKFLCDSGVTVYKSGATRTRPGAAILNGYINDPNTSAAWTITNFNAAEFGLEIV